MERREVLAIALLVLLILVPPVVLTAWSAGNRPEEPPVFEGTAMEIYQQHAALMDAAAEILWRHVEIFEAIREGEGDRCTSYLASDFRENRIDHAGMTEAEWLTVCRMVEETGMSSVHCYLPVYGHAPGLLFTFRCTDSSKYAMVYLRQDEDAPEEERAMQATRQAAYIGKGRSVLEETVFPYWYEHTVSQP